KDAGAASASGGGGGGAGGAAKRGGAPSVKAVGGADGTRGADGGPDTERGRRSGLETRGASGGFGGPLLTRRLSRSPKAFAISSSRLITSVISGSVTGASGTSGAS